MNRTIASIYVKAENKQLSKAQISELRQAITNDGCLLRNKTFVYADIGDSKENLNQLVRDAERRRFQVIYVNYSYMRVGYINPVKEALRTSYTYGVSAIVCT